MLRNKNLLLIVVGNLISQIIYKYVLMKNLKKKWLFLIEVLFRAILSI
jgi:hypothetical protein